MFGQDEMPEEEGKGQEAQSPMRSKLLQQIIEMLTKLPDQEAKPEDGSLEIEIAPGGEADPKKAFGA